MLKLDDLAKLVQEYFHDCDPCGDVVKRDRDLALKIARACLTEMANRIKKLRHGTGPYDVVQEIRSLLANLEGGAAC